MWKWTKKKETISTPDLEIDSVKEEGQKAQIYFAGGCFWGVEKYFACIPGVVQTDVGYANGNGDNPTYEQVCTGNTNFAETVHITYDADRLSLSFLLSMYFKVIDPVAVNRQGNDVGSQYRTGIYYVDIEDRTIIERSLKELSLQYDKPIAIECQPLINYFKAEAYHQEYLDKNPHGYCHIGASLFKEAANAKPIIRKEDANKYQKPSQAVLAQMLTPIQYKVTQENETEPPFYNQYWDFYEKGIYVEITTGEPLFISSDKFESGCGWPSFSKPISKEVLNHVEDNSASMHRTEVRSDVGDSHLGHVFDDGPMELGGLRYCINSAAIRFIPLSKMSEEGYEEYIKLVE